jgi:hypothetical protein
LLDSLKSSPHPHRDGRSTVHHFASAGTDQQLGTTSRDTMASDDVVHHVSYVFEREGWL